MERHVDARGWDLLRQAMDAPNAEAYLSQGRLQREVRRLETRLRRLQARGGAYRDVEMSDNVGALLARLEAGATLSTLVH